MKANYLDLASKSAASETLVPPGGHRPGEFRLNFVGYFRITESLTSKVDCHSSNVTLFLKSIHVKLTPIDFKVIDSAVTKLVLNASSVSL